MASEIAAAPQLEPPEGEPVTEVHKVVAPAGEKGGKSKDKGKEKGGKSKDKGKGKAAAPAADGGAPTIAAHPAAVRSIARVKGWAGLIGFALGGYLSLPTSTLAGAGLRALVAGVVCYLVAWAGAVFAWRRLVVLEVKAREQEMLDAVKRAAEARSQAAGRAGARDAP